MPRLRTASNEIARSCVMSRVRVLNRAVTRIYDDALRDLGLTAAQLNLLVVVEQFGAARPVDISRTIGIDMSTLSRNLSRMVKNGWLILAKSSDARSQPVSLTAEGARLVAQAYPCWKQAQGEIEKSLGSEFIEAVFAAAEQYSEM